MGGRSRKRAASLVSVAARKKACSQTVNTASIDLNTADDSTDSEGESYLDLASTKNKEERLESCRKRLLEENNSSSNSRSEAIAIDITVFESMKEQLKTQQSCINELNSKLDNVLSVMQNITFFLGIETDSKQVESDTPVDQLCVNSVDQSGVISSASCLPAPAVVPLVTSAPRDHGAVNHGIKRNNDSSTLKEIVINAIHKESAEREKRANSVIISGVKPSLDRTDYVIIRTLFNTEFNFDTVELKCFRLGRKYPDYIQPLLVTLGAKDDASWLVANSGLLRRSSDQWTRENIFINRNMSRAERRAAFEMRSKRRAHRLSVNVSGSTRHRPEHDSENAHGGGDDSNHEPGRPIRVIVNGSRRFQGNDEPPFRLNDLNDFPFVRGMDYRATTSLQPVQAVPQSNESTRSNSQLISGQNPVAVTAMSEQSCLAQSRSPASSSDPSDGVSLSTSAEGPAPGSTERRQ